MSKKLHKPKQTFLAGEEWLYYKIYTGYNSSDIILTQVISPIVNKLLKDKVIDKWFFIRYSDPKHHIRLRFRLPKTENIHLVMGALNLKLQKFIASDLVWNVQLDIYKREIERYGEATIEASEELFFHDSKMVAAFLDLIEGAAGEELRWMFCLKAIDALLEDFNYSLEQKISLTDNLRAAYGSEFDFSTAAKKQINTKYAVKRNAIAIFMERFELDGTQLPELEKILQDKSRKIKSTVKIIVSLHQNGKMENSLDNFMTSHIHMTANRLFKSKSRLNETIVYEFLYKYYKSVQAIKAKQILSQQNMQNQ